MDAPALKKAKKTFSTVGFALILFYAVSLGVGLLLTLPYTTLSAKLPFLRGIAPADFSLIASAIGMYLFGLPAALLLLARLERRPPKKGKILFSEWVALFFAALFLLYVGNTVGLFFGGLFERVGLSLADTTMEALSASDLLLTLIMTVFLGPFCEELLFRKTILDRTCVYGEKLAILFSALLFAFWHADLYQFFYTFLIGLLLGYAYLRTGRLWVSVCIHGAINFCGALPLLLDKYMHVTAMAEELATYGAAEDGEVFFDYIIAHLPQLTVLYQYSIAVYGAVALGGVFFFVYSRRIHFLKRGSELPRDSEGVTAFAAPGVVLFILSSLGLMLLENYLLR